LPEALVRQNFLVTAIDDDSRLDQQRRHGRIFQHHQIVIAVDTAPLVDPRPVLAGDRLGMMQASVSAQADRSSVPISSILCIFNSVRDLEARLGLKKGPVENHRPELREETSKKGTE